MVQVGLLLSDVPKSVTPAQQLLHRTVQRPGQRLPGQQDTHQHYTHPDLTKNLCQSIAL